MLKFLFIAFFIFPTGEVQTLKRPVATVAECRILGDIAVKEANNAGVLVIGDCIKPADYVVRTNT